MTRPSEQGRTSDCGVCGATTARMANGEKPAKGTGAGWVARLAPGTVQFAFFDESKRDEFRRGAMSWPHAFVLCPHCAGVVRDVLLGAGVPVGEKP